MTSGPSNHINDDKLVALVERLYQAGETDALEGGVAPAQAAEHVDYCRSTVSDRLRDLVDDGRLVEVRGANPETHTPRRSFIPADCAAARDGGDRAEAEDGPQHRRWVG